jgi:predicted Ser/Thr protein kinase
VTTVGRFELLGQIGYGGMAVVHLARQLDLDRLVALKELRMRDAQGAMLKRFLREARLGGSMNHPNVVTVYEHFEYADTPYIAMEYVQGGSLRPRIGQLDLAQVFGVLEGVLAALDHAERLGIVHRDLKPENLLVTDRGQIKVADFGIAKALALTGTAELTSTGAFLGTPAYMAPEQAFAQTVGPYTDLYAVGVLTFEMLVGRVPFVNSEVPLAALLRRVYETIPPASSIDPEIDDGLSEWIDRLIAKDPTARTQKAEQAWEELEEIALRLLGPRWRRGARCIVPGAELSAATVRSAKTAPPSGAAETASVPISDKMEVGGTDGAEAPREPVAEAEPAIVGRRDVFTQNGGPASTAARNAARRGGVRRLLTAPAARHRGAAAALAAASLVLPLAALVLRPSTRPSPVAPTPRAGTLALALPSGWRRIPDPDVEGLRDAVALASPRAEPTLRVRAGTVAQPGAVPGDLPSRLVGDAPVSGSAYVRLGGEVPARQYDLTAAHVDQRLRVYVIAGDRRDHAISCAMASDRARTGLAACDALAARARLQGEGIVAPGIDIAVAATLRRLTVTLDRAGRRLEPLLGDRSRARRAEAAAGLASAYRAAGATVGALRPRTRDADGLASVKRRLEQLASAYAELAARARDGSRRRYNEARARQRRSQQLLRAALTRLARIGYIHAS